MGVGDRIAMFLADNSLEDNITSQMGTGSSHLIGLHLVVTLRTASQRVYLRRLAASSQASYGFHTVVPFLKPTPAD